MPRKKIDLAVVGIGPMAARHVEAIREVDSLRVVSCVSRTREKAEKFAHEHAIANPRTFEQLLRQPEVDALWVSVSAPAMASVARELNALALPMFLEKPIGLSLQESRAARDSITVPHMVGLNRRFYEIVVRGRELIDQHGGVRAIEVHMPEYVSPLVDRVGREMVKQWQFANSIHLIDLFRFFGGEVHSVATNNVVNGVDDRSYSALLSFVSGATGIYHAQWYAPGGWRLAVYGSDISVVFQPIEQAVVMERGHDRFPIEAVGPDRRFKPGLYGQARAFVAAVMEGKRVNGVSNLADYVRSVELVDAMTETRGFANRATLSAPAGTN